jgi:hypothetical protein
MKKIPTMYERVFENHKVIGTIEKFTDPSFENILQNGIPTIKYDGAACAIIDGKFYKRYDAKKGKAIPENAIKCQEEADPITGHLPCWVKVDVDNPADKWFVNAYNNTPFAELYDNSTYEAIGVHFQGNPYGLSDDILERHGVKVIEVERTFEGIKKYLEDHYIEGIVFWKDGEPKCKIKRSDFGFKWGSER